MCLILLNLDNSEALKNGENKNCNDEYRCYIFYNNCKECFPLEFSTLLNFFNERLRLDNVADKNTGEKSNDGHNHAVADKVKEIKELEADDCEVTPDAVA